MQGVQFGCRLISRDMADAVMGKQQECLMIAHSSVVIIVTWPMPSVSFSFVLFNLDKQSVGERACNIDSLFLIAVNGPTSQCRQ